MMVAILGAISAVLVAVIGGLVTYGATHRLNRRVAQLARIDRQLSELYGPMVSILGANERAYRAFLSLNRDGAEKFFDPSLPEPNDSSLRIWRLWVTKILQPGNRRIYDLITERADLLIDREMPDVLLQFCAHVSSWEVTISRWEEGDYSLNWGGVTHPRASIDDYAKSAFAGLKAQQDRLLRLTEK